MQFLLHILKLDVFCKANLFPSIIIGSTIYSSQRTLLHCYLFHCSISPFTTKTFDLIVLVLRWYNFATQRKEKKTEEN